MLLLVFPPCGLFPKPTAPFSQRGIFILKDIGLFSLFFNKYLLSNHGFMYRFTLFALKSLILWVLTLEKLGMDKKRLAQELLKVAKDLVGGNENKDYFFSSLLPVLKKMRKIGRWPIRINSKGELSIDMGEGDFLYATPEFEGKRVYIESSFNDSVDSWQGGTSHFPLTYDVKKDIKTYSREIISLARDMNIQLLTGERVEF